MCIWKRIESITIIDSKFYLIHLEIRPDGYKYYPATEEESS
jgi:hypothetical protein